MRLGAVSAPSQKGAPWFSTLPHLHPLDPEFFWVERFLLPV